MADQQRPDFPTPPPHDPTKDPKGDNPFIYVDDDEVVWSWDFIKGLWFVFKDDEQESVATTNIKRPLDDKNTQTQPPRKKQKENPQPQAPASIYVENLPCDTTEEEIITYFSKTGIIKRDEYTGEYKVKLYTEEDGKTLKGEALITYFKPESVLLALDVLDGSDFRYKHPIKVTQVL